MPATAAAADDGALVLRGAYLARAAGCIGCHTDPKSKGTAYAGGRAFKTDFGTYYSPNITPHPTAGIGAWSDQDFVRALRDGVSPAGEHYFPVFPYPSYTRMRDADMLAIKTYLFTQPASDRANRAHNAGPPYGWRWSLWFWKKLYFEPGAMPAKSSRSPAWNRGAYLVGALAHCGECHTPRNALGAVRGEFHLAGTVNGPDGELVPNITPDRDTGIGAWDEEEIVTLLKEGLKPDYDDVQGSMSETIEEGLSHLNEADLQAIAVYLKTLAPIRNKIEKPSSTGK
jgi:mono/diheme cytochrome c family protein